MLQMIVRADTEEAMERYALIRGEEITVGSKLCENLVLCGCLEQLLSDAYGTRLQASQDRLFDMLG